MGTKVGWDNDKINKWVVRCMDEVMVGMEQLRVQAEVQKGQRMWKRAQACRDAQSWTRAWASVDKGVGMLGCTWACLGMLMTDRGKG